MKNIIDYIIELKVIDYIQSASLCMKNNIEFKTHYDIIPKHQHL